MGDWNRSTRKIVIDEIQPEFMKAIREHIESYNLKLDFSDYLICIETASSKKKKKLFGGGIPDQVIQVSILTPSWLVIAAQGDKPESVGVLSIQQKNAAARDYKDDPGYKIIPDTGLFVTGLFTGRVGMQGNSDISTFLALGEEPAAEEFKKILFETTANAKK